MFGFCRDPFVKEMSRLGFTLIPLPEAGITPLQCYGRQGKALYRLGTIDRLFRAGTFPKPDIDPDIDMGGELTRFATSDLDPNLGLAMLTEWLGDLAPELSAKFNRSSKFAFHLREVRKDRIELKPLDDYLRTASLNVAGPMVRQLIDNDDVYVTIATLKTRAMEVATKSGTLMEGKIEVPDIIAPGVSGDASVKVRKESETGLLFEASRPMPFAFQAVKLSFSDGIYRTLKVDRSGYQMMSEDNLRTQNAAAETGWLCDEIGSTFPRFVGRPGMEGASSSSA